MSMGGFAREIHKGDLVYILALAGSLAPASSTPKGSFLDLRYFFRGDTLIDAIAVGCLVVIGIVLAVATYRRHMGR